MKKRMESSQKNIYKYKKLIIKYVKGIFHWAEFPLYARRLRFIGGIVAT